MVVWDREDCLREANSKLSNKDLYRELKGDGRGFLSKVIESVFGKIRNRVDINDKTLHYFYVKRWLSKIHKRLHSVPGGPVIIKSSYFTENISSFLNFPLKPLLQKVKSYIQDTNNLLKKIANLPLCQITLFFHNRSSGSLSKYTS